MKNIKNILVVIIALCACNHALARDKSVDCAGRPRWDRFVIDEHTDKWDPKSAECFGTVTTGIDTNAARLYGQPGMYGEYDGAAESGAHQKYDPRAMYGKYDVNGNFAKPRPAPFRAAAPTPLVSNAKHPVIVKPAKPATKKPMPIVVTAKPVAKPKPLTNKTPKVVACPEPLPVVAVAVAPEPKSVPVVLNPKPVSAAPVAQNITKALKDKPIDPDSFCTQLNAPVLGPMPKGIVLMTGRPDRMSCVVKK